MSQESLDHIVGGALFDFAGFLTTRPERLICSASDDAAPMAEAVKDFMELRGVDQNCEPMIALWPMRMSNGKCKTFDELFDSVLPYEHEPCNREVVKEVCRELLNRAKAI